ncbi:hypothetical protein ACIQMP_28115 [Streptomyces sp. NPDC091385]|uniref:hypothetical protein n=1 Tax=Streptomyces sp. NPDC091385 TaxID=3365997 RepID=UPI00381CE545
MTDTSTTQAPSPATDSAWPQPYLDAAEPDGHGRHRGQVASQDGEAAPRGRHRRPGAGAEGQTRV